MPTLNWIGKEAVVNHHLQVPFRLLKDVSELACGDPGSGNGGNVLTRAVLGALPPCDGPKVIYCAGCLLGRDRLATERIVIRQTPYEFKVS